MDLQGQFRGNSEILQFGFSNYRLWTPQLPRNFKVSTQKQLLGFVRAGRLSLPCLPFKILTGRLARAPREKGIFLF